MEYSTKKAPSGQFRVIGQDHSGDKGWRKGDYPTLSEAATQANPRGHSTIRFRVYDDRGKCVHGNGL
ncbi:hypothetical protein LCGC14_2304740 [marine sediment metagenome]|uniref:Uncharacterized protein n=1 Tax=marine sediment metagenome TaxID=412755 RepID=A0A0F9D9V3_9ZZZZ